MDADLTVTPGNADLLAAIGTLKDLVCPSFLHLVLQSLKPLHDLKLKCQILLILPEPAIDIPGKYAIVEEHQTDNLQHKPQLCTDKPVHHNECNDQIQQKPIQFITSVAANHKPPELISYII